MLRFVGRDSAARMTAARRKNVLVVVGDLLDSLSYVVGMYSRESALCEPPGIPPATASPDQRNFGPRGSLCRNREPNRYGRDVRLTGAGRHRGEILCGRLSCVPNRPAEEGRTIPRPSIAISPDLGFCASTPCPRGPRAGTVPRSGRADPHARCRIRRARTVRRHDLQRSCP